MTKHKDNNEKDLGKISSVDFKKLGLSRSELHWSQKRFDEYKVHYHIASLSDLQILAELVFREVLQERNKKLVGENKESITSRHMQETLDSNLDKIIILKDRLGLFKEKREDDPFTYIQILKKKFDKWRSENQGSRTLTCPHCSKTIMLKIRTDAWEAQKHSFFQDRILSNVHLWKLYKEGKITKEDIVSILCVSLDYVNWLEEKIYNKPSK